MAVAEVRNSAVQSDISPCSRFRSS